MKTTVYLSRKLLNQLKVKETESKDLMLTHNLHNIIINGKRVGCSDRISALCRNCGSETYGLQKSVFGRWCCVLRCSRIRRLTL